MEKEGYDDSQPIITWNRVVIDGHTRLLVATELGYETVPVFEHEFESEDEALKYAIHNQRNRRNLTEAELLRCIEVVDERMGRGENLKEYPRNEQGHIIKPQNIRSNILGHTQTASTVGISPSKVQQARKVLDDPVRMEEVKSGEKSIHKAYQEIKKEEKQKPKPSEKPTFNRTNDNIEWAYWSWNPVTGCKHNCSYCYARDIANRFYEQKFEPTFHENRLSAPQNTPIPKNDEQGEHNVFVCSMADLFGSWVPDEWIKKVMKSCIEAPDWWNFIFLTKNPKRYQDIKNWPKRCWIGATADTQERADKAIEIFSKLPKDKTLFLSCEPLLEQITIPNNHSIKWLIIGAQSRSSREPEMQPIWQWVETLHYSAVESGLAGKIYWKPNLTIRPRGYPNERSEKQNTL